MQEQLEDPVPKVARGSQDHAETAEIRAHPVVSDSPALPARLGGQDGVATRDPAEQQELPAVADLPDRRVWTVPTAAEDRRAALVYRAPWERPEALVIRELPEQPDLPVARARWVCEALPGRAENQEPAVRRACLAGQAFPVTSATRVLPVYQDFRARLDRRAEVVPAARPVLPASRELLALSGPRACLAELVSPDVREIAAILEHLVLLEQPERMALWDLQVLPEELATRASGARWVQPGRQDLVDVRVSTEQLGNLE